jgi:hypothetical protein
MPWCAPASCRGELDAFAARLARFHAQAPVAGPDSDWGRPAQVGQAIADVLDQLAALLSGAEAARLAALRAWFGARQPALAGHWAARRAAGQVRECHGDLHLGNVVRIDGEITAFDCLEFSPALRWIDTLADAGFLTMDLHAHGRPDLAWRFLDAYLAASGDYAGLAVLRPYEVYRALVRALVARLRASQGAAQGPDYLACAERLAAPWARACSSPMDCRARASPRRPRSSCNRGRCGCARTWSASACTAWRRWTIRPPWAWTSTPARPHAAPSRSWPRRRAPCLRPVTR